MTNSKVVFQTTRRSEWSNRASALGMASVAVRRRWRARRSPTPDIKDTAAALPSSTSARTATRAAAGPDAATSSTASASRTNPSPASDRKCRAPIAATTNSGPTVRLSRPAPAPPTQQPARQQAKAASRATACIGRFQNSRPGAAAPDTAVKCTMTSPMAIMAARRRVDCRSGAWRRTQQDGRATTIARSSEAPTARGCRLSGKALKPSSARILAAQTPEPAARALKPAQARATEPLSSRCWLRSHCDAAAAVAQISPAAKT